MPVRLTETAITKALKDVAVFDIRRDLADMGCPGLRLRMTPAGARTEPAVASWVLACRDREGRMRRFPIGAWPGMGVRVAREAARALHAKVKHEGADPVAARKRERATGKDARDGVGTFQALLTTYSTKRGAELRSWGEAQKRIELVFKALLKRPMAALSADDFQAEADSYKFDTTAALAVRSVRPVLKWGAQRGQFPRAVAVIDPPVAVKRRTRILTADELKTVLPALTVSSRPYAPALRLMLLTVTRREEVAGMKWGEVDLEGETWTIPAERSKNGSPHVVPLSTQAAALLASRRPKKPAAKALVFATGTGERLANWDRETKMIQKASKTAGWSRHDLRRTGATMMGEMGVLPDLIEAALNHVSIRSQLAATYNASRYRPEVSTALQRLADALDVIEHGPAKESPTAEPIEAAAA